MKASLFITFCLLFIGLQAQILILPTEANNYSPIYNWDGPRVADTLMLRFGYAARENVALESCQGLVYWNNKVVATLAPNDYSLNQFVVRVNVTQGSNNLTFAGAGTSDSYGLTIDNITLTQNGSTDNFVLNGDF
jgi:hypothetical protein